jgi:methylphosphotriester-DNA--protein-cysteine methyltransferase
VRLPAGALFWLKGAFRFLRAEPNAISFLPLATLPDFLRALNNAERLPSDKAHPDPLVTRALRLLEQVDTPTLEELGREVELTPSHFQKRFKLAMGCSPLQYANAWKLDALAEEIRRGNTFSLLDLAVEYGFNDPKHFRELFRRRFGVTPSAYRKNPPSKA